MDSLARMRSFAVNNAWSNFRLYRACLALSKEEFDAERTSFFPSIPRTLNHILIVDWYYIDALTAGGKGRSVFENEVPFPEIGPLWAAQQESDKRLVAFTQGLTGEADLDAPVNLERKDYVQVERVEDVLTHLGMHQIHHRGQAHAMLSGTSVKPPQLDDFFLR